MQKEDGNKNLLRPNTGNQRQQIQPRRDIKNRRVRDKIYCKDPIENGGHLSLLSNHSALFNSQPSTNRSQLLFMVTGHILWVFTDECCHPNRFRVELMLIESFEIGRLDFPNRDALESTHCFLPNENGASWGAATWTDKPERANEL